LAEAPFNESEVDDKISEESSGDSDNSPAHIEGRATGIEEE